MRALLDTNILIHRESAVVVRDDIGQLFAWLDRLGAEKWVHPVTQQEIERHGDPRVRRAFAAKLAAYRMMQAPAPVCPAVEQLSREMDSSANDRADTRLVNELYARRVDLLISEDRGVAEKADRLGIGHQVYSIQSFIEKCVAEYPALSDYRVLGVRKVLCGNLDVRDPFFDTFRSDYPGFDAWFSRKSEEEAYICEAEQGLLAFLYLKLEEMREPYADIVPRFEPARRLKIGTFKVVLNGYRIGERLLKIVFDNALRMRVDHIYVTVFDNSPDQRRLIRLIEDFGFGHHGSKQNPYGTEQVYVRSMKPSFDAARPALTFPYVSRRSRSFLVPIYQKYHTELLPDSILRTESPEDYLDPQPHRNGIRKSYISRAINRDIRPGDTIVFYRTGGYRLGVATTLGIVEGVHRSIRTEDEFIAVCRKRSVFTDDELRSHWRYDSRSRPFVVDFLYAYPLPKRPNMAALIENGVIAGVDAAPRGFLRISDDQFDTIIRLSQSDSRIVVD